jgi:hypothetical protein
MSKKATHEELEQRGEELEKEAVERKRVEETLRRERNMLQELLAKIKVLSEWYAEYARTL